VADQDGGVHAGEPALPLAEGSADGVDDHGVAHGRKLEHVLVSDNPGVEEPRDEASRNLP
jgi:hypothetical protein